MDVRLIPTCMIPAVRIESITNGGSLLVHYLVASLLGAIYRFLWDGGAASTRPAKSILPGGLKPAMTYMQTYSK